MEKTYLFPFTLVLDNDVFLLVRWWLCFDVIWRKTRRGAVQFHFPFQLIGTRLNGHAGAVKTERKQHPLPLQTLIPYGEFAFWERERVPQMQSPVHVRKRESAQEFLLGSVSGFNRRIFLVDFFVTPTFLNLAFDALEVLDFEGAFPFQTRLNF